MVIPIRDWVQRKQDHKSKFDRTPWSPIRILMYRTWPMNYSHLYVKWSFRFKILLVRSEDASLFTMDYKERIYSYQSKKAMMRCCILQQVYQPTIVSIPKLNQTSPSKKARFLAGHSLSICPCSFYQTQVLLRLCQYLIQGHMLVDTQCVVLFEIHESHWFFIVFYSLKGHNRTIAHRCS